MMTPGQIITVALLLCILWGGVTLMIAPDRVSEAFAVERAQAEAWFGEKRASEMYAVASRLIAPLFGAEQPPERVLENIAPRIVGATIKDLQPILTQAVFRAMVSALVLVLMLPFIAAAILDGVVVRLKKREQLHSENPRIYHLTKHMLVVLMIAPLIILTVPVGLGPVLAIIWALTVVLAGWGMAQNVEQEI